MSNLTSRASRRVRFEEVTPAHEYAAFFNVSIAPLVAHLGLPIFDGYDDLDDLQLAFLTLPSGGIVTLSEYAGAPGTSLSVEVAMQNIPQIIFDSCQQLRVSRQELEWVNPDWQVEFEGLYAKHVEIKGIERLSTVEEFPQSNEYEPIDCFYYALEIYTRQKFPEYWAMLQHNLGLAYFDRIKGERWENLRDSIECFNKSLQVFTQERFPQKWQINQEDLKQSLEVQKIEKQSLIKDILDISTTHLKLIGIDLSHENLSWANLKYADLRYANLNNADLNNANLFYANLSSATLNDSNLFFSILCDAMLCSASLRGANLSSANLADADLSDADLSNVDLSGAYLRGADLRNANLKIANVVNATFGSNRGVSDSMRQDLISRGAVFEDAPGDRSESRTLVPR